MSVRECLFSVHLSITITYHSTIFFDEYMTNEADMKYKIRKRDVNKYSEVGLF